MRELVLDTETTGLDFLNGDRIVEIGIVELENHIQTGNYFHYYLNPEKDSSLEALKVHGLTREFLSDKLKFKDIADEFLEFIGDSKIIIHNASFDLGFINTELEKCNIEKINEASIIDTLVLAKNKFRGQSVSLDSLCRKYNIDIRDREIHGALKDAKLLALVYLELIGGKQTTLRFNSENDIDKSFDNRYLLDINTFYNKRKILKKKNIKLDQHDYQLHLQSLKEIRESIWEKIKY